LDKTSQKIKQLENALAESEARLSIISDLSYDILWEWDLKTGFYKWIGDIDTYLGYKKNEFPRTIEGWENILHPNDKERVLRDLNDHHNGHNKWHKKYRIFKKDGELRWWVDRGVTRLDNDGNPHIMTGAITDITEILLYKNSISELEIESNAQKIQNQFFKILDQMPVCFHIQNSDYTVPYANKMFRERFGSPEKGMCYELMHDREKPCEPCSTFKTFETRTTKKNIWTTQDDKTYLTVTTPFHGFDNKLQIMEMSMDISQQKRFEESLLISEKQFRTIFEKCPLGVAMIDSLTGHIYEVNRKFADIAGRSLSEMATIDWMSITHPDDVQEDLDNMAALNSGTISGFNMEKRYIKPDGSYVWINMTISPLSVENKNSPRHLCMIEDISEKKRIEKDLTRFGRLLNSSSNEIYMFDASTLKFTQVNSGACENLGYSTDELLQMTPLDIALNYNLETFEKLIEPLKEKKIIIVSVESVHKRKDGTLYPVNVRVQLIHEESPPLFIAIVEDITNRKKVEEELEKYQNHLEEVILKRTVELKESQDKLMHSEKLSALGKFVGTIAHEFNNPLFGVINLIEQMGENLNKNERKKFSELAHKECWRMADMIKNLQSFYKPTDEVFSEADMKILLEEIFLIISKACKNKNIFLNKKFKTGKYLFTGIEDQIKQVLLNVLQNAIDSISNKGYINVSLAKTDNEILIEIQDTGHGIEKNNQKYIFDPFYTTRGKEGTGLGLSVSFGIIKKHGGQICIESEPNIGSTVTLTLPIKQKI
jgi:PAS domain S-box-containing protein